jgi:uncharacterized RDD family membrane protein YckC
MPVSLGVGTRPQYAGFWVRLAALLLDGLILLIPMILTAITFIGPIAVVWLYTALMMSSSKQGTVGMMAMGLRVTDEDGNRITFGRATARYFSSILSSMILYIGFLMLLWNGRKQTLHDQMAGTLILHGRGDLLAGWADPAPAGARQDLTPADARRRAETSLQLADTLVAQIEQQSITLDLLPADSSLRRQYALSLQLRADGARLLERAGGTAALAEADRKINAAVAELQAVRDTLSSLPGE